VAGRRRVRFNLIGLLGYAVQSLTLWLLDRWAGLGTVPAVTIAVLAAVSHNFLWHERVTWPGLPREQRLRRWASFHVATGGLSVASNVVVTTALVAVAGLPVVTANLVAVLVMSAASFPVSDRTVFRA
jgi:putative flippase GtrA